MVTREADLTLDDFPLRDDLKGLTPYGAPQLDVPIRLNVNESAFDVPDEIVDAVGERVRAAVRGANRYPDREFSELRLLLARYVGHDVAPEQIWAANGSNEVLQHVLQAFGGPGRRVLSFSPTYSMYPLLSQGIAMEYRAVPRRDDFTIDAALVREAVAEHDPDIILLCGPNNPTGTKLDRTAIEAALESRAMVVVDEAYIEFAKDPGRTAISLLPERPRLMVSRTMSKAFAYAGVRLGYLIAHPVVIDALRLVRLPYHLSVLTQAAACAALEHSDVMLAQVEQLRQQRDILAAGLTDLGLQPYPSDANFVLAGGIDDPQAMFAGLLAEGVLVRDVGLPGTLRITAGTEEETRQALAAMERVLRA